MSAQATRTFHFNEGVSNETLYVSDRTEPDQSPLVPG